MIGRFIGLPTRTRPAVNDVRVVEGQYLTPNARREALLEVDFARRRGIALGDTMIADVAGEEWEFRVVGLVQSPEYIIAVRNRQYTAPHPSIFGVVFLSNAQAQQTFGREGEINEVCVRLGEAPRSVLRAPRWDGSSLGAERLAAISDMERGARSAEPPQSAIHAMLVPYGADEPTPREEQPSHKRLARELESIRRLALVFPSLFLGTAAMTIYVLMMRVVYSQRSHIGFLRASGFSEGDVVRHYLSFSLAAGVLGGTIGVAGGYLLAYSITRTYVTTLSIPYLATQLRWDAVAIGLTVSFVTCLAGGFVPARSAGRLPPAVALRDEAPVSQRRPWFERVAPVSRRLPYLLKVPLRNLLRSRRRTLSTALGIAAGTSLVLVAATFLDAIDDALAAYFGKVQRYDTQVIFVPPQSEDMVYHLAGRDGVRLAEPVLLLPVVLDSAYGAALGSGLWALGSELKPPGEPVGPTVRRSTRLQAQSPEPRAQSASAASFPTLMLGLRDASDLYRVLDARGRPIRLQDGMLYVGNLIRDHLGLETGDPIRVRYAFSSKERSAVGVLRVAPPITQPATAIVYASLATTRRLFGAALDLPERPVSGILLTLDPGSQKAVRQSLYALPHAAAVEITAETQAEIEAKMRFIRVFIRVMLLFGITLAFAIVFNMLSITVLERAREIASLRTLGFRFGQIALVTSVENLIVALFGLMLGLPLGHLLALWLVQTFRSETVTLQAVIYPRTYAVGALGMLAVVFLAQLPALHNTLRLDLARATKERSG